MPILKRKKGTIGILTGGGDVPGLNPAIRAVTIRAIREGFGVIGLRRGWKGPSSIIRDMKLHQEECFQVLTEEIVNKVGRTGGTFLHTSRIRHSHIPQTTFPTIFKAGSLRNRVIGSVKAGMADFLSSPTFEEKF